MIYYQHKAGRARRTLRGTGEQAAKAAKAAAGLAGPLANAVGSAPGQVKEQHIKGSRSR